MREMRTFIRDNRKIHISETVIEILKMHKQKSKEDNESGGVLIGQVKDDDIYILKASIPNKFDKASQNCFKCNKDIAQILINHEFYNGDKRSIYLGEWHTHFEAIPAPSSIDKGMIKEQFKKNKLNEPFLILVIQGTEDVYVSLYDGEKIHEE